MQVPDIAMVRLCWNRKMLEPFPIRGFYTLYIDPEPGFPSGRKGLALASAWDILKVPTAAGMLLLDGDVAIDPGDLAAMFEAINGQPHDIHVAPAKLWPASTSYKTWVWAHGRGALSTNDIDDPDLWSFCFTYLPRALLDDCPGLADWRFPGVDRQMGARAIALGIPVHVVRDCSPKHCNF